MEKFKEALKRYKWIIVSGLTIAILAGVITANIHIFQLMSYKMQANTPAIIQLMERDLKNTKRQDGWYFSQGIDYLVQDMSEETKEFFETHFAEFIPDIQDEIIKEYNRRNLFFANQSILTNIILDNIDKEVYSGYFKRIDEVSVDEMLANYFGEDVALTEDFIDKLYKITSIYPKQLLLDEFEFDVYGLLVLEDVETSAIEVEESATSENIEPETTPEGQGVEGVVESTEDTTTTDANVITDSETVNITLEEKKNTIFKKLAPEKAKKMIFDKLKTSPIQIETLKELMDFLNRNNIVDTKTYTSFNNFYSEIHLIRKQYSEIDGKEVDLQNKKSAVELQISEPQKNIESKQVELKNAQAAVSEVENKLASLTGYAYMALYIEKAYGNGEYEASIPTTGLFGNFRPSSQKYIIKLTTSQFSTPGVYYVNITLQGTKVNNKGNEYPYYVEVSQSQLDQIAALQEERQAKVKAVSNIQGEIATIEAKITAIKEENGYAAIEKELKNLAVERETYAEKLDEKAVEIQKLLNIGRVIANLTEE